MLKEGFIDQQIQIASSALAKTFFNQERMVHEITDPYRNEGANKLNKRLIDLLADGKINEAENLLFQAIQTDTNIDYDYLRVALDFYLKLEQYPNDYLKLCNFSRVEISDGWTALTSEFRIE